MKINTTLKYTASSVILASLFACGGGSDTAPSKPVANTCTNGAGDYPTCTQPITQAVTQVAASPDYVFGSSQLAVFNALNDVRKNMGLSPLNQNKTLDLSTANHQNYLDLSWIPGENGHTEIAGRAGFTGESPSTRASFLKLNASVGEVMTSDSRDESISGLLGVSLHRQSLLDDGWSDVGISSSDGKGTIIDLMSRL